MSVINYFAESSSASGNVFIALGIDWRLLILQIIAFLILVWLLAKFVYPWLLKQVDERQAVELRAQRHFRLRAQLKDARVAVEVAAGLAG